MAQREVEICKTLGIVEMDDAPHTKCMGHAVLGDLNFLMLKLLTHAQLSECCQSVQCSPNCLTLTTALLAGLALGDLATSELRCSTVIQVYTMVLDYFNSHAHAYWHPM